jgi:hypothetical protein
MSTRDVELQAGAPATFNGSIKKATRWLYSIKVYFTINASIYNTKDKKVITTLMYMTEGTTGAWASTYYQMCD